MLVRGSTLRLRQPLHLATRAFLLLAAPSQRTTTSLTSRLLLMFHRPLYPRLRPLCVTNGFPTWRVVCGLRGLAPHPSRRASSLLVLPWSRCRSVVTSVETHTAWSSHGTASMPATAVFRTLHPVVKSEAPLVFVQLCDAFGPDCISLRLRRSLAFLNGQRTKFGGIARSLC